MVYSHVLIFDTNVFKRILENGSEYIYDSIFAQLNQALNPKGAYTGFLSTTSPFQLLEFLGRIPPNISIQEFSKEEIKQYGFTLLNLVFERALLEYKKHPDLTEVSLRERNEQNKLRLSAKASKLYDDIVGKIVSRDGFSELLKQNLALDFAYRFPFSKIVRGEDLIRIHANSLIDIYRSEKKQANFTQMRGVLKFCEHLQKVNGREPIDEAAKQIFEATKGIKEFRDLVDLDLIQYASLGVFLNSVKYPCLIITGDTKESFVNRLRLFKSTFVILDQKIKAENYLNGNDLVAQVVPKEGVVAFVDMDTWTISEYLDISSIPAVVDDLPVNTDSE